MSILTKQNIDEIVFQYNNSKPIEWESIHSVFSLQNIFCGFSIKSTKAYSVFILENNNCRQIKIYKKYLTAFNNYPSLLIEEELLLFSIMCLVLGKENVKYYKSFSSALSTSPNTNVSFINIKKSPVSDLTSSHLLCSSNSKMTTSPKIFNRCLPI